ncbi:MAG: glycosyltransferase family 2 protein [Chloroflexota bacterium]
MRPRVSVLVPTYNYGRYLLASVGSALGQTLPELEVIVVDDGSTDETEAVLAVLRVDPRVRTFRQDRRGPGAARNRALVESSSPFIAMLDADDVWFADKLARQLAVLESDPSIGLAYTNSVVDDLNGRLERRHFDQHSGHRPHVGWVMRQLAIANFLTTSTVVVRREVLDATGGYDESLQVCEDWDLWLRIAARAPMAYVDTIGARVRRHGANTHLRSELMVRDSFRVLARVPAYAGGWDRLGRAARSRAHARAHSRAAASTYAAGHSGQALQHIARAILFDPRHATVSDLRLALRCTAALFGGGHVCRKPQQLL